MKVCMRRTCGWRKIIVFHYVIHVHHIFLSKVPSYMMTEALRTGEDNIRSL
jgi:hypothetical protein